jgi:hypothetical protein
MPDFIARARRAVVAVIGLFLRLIRDSVLPRAAYCLAHPATCAFRFFKRVIFLASGVVVFVLSAILALNVAFHTPLNVAFRALDPRSEACRAPPEGWDILANDTIGNDEWLAADQPPTTEAGVGWEMRLRCSIQTHAIPGYQPTSAEGMPMGEKRSLSYDLAFLEFQEDGNPYVLCTQEEYARNLCDGVTVNSSAAGEAPRRGQLEALVEQLRTSPKNFVVVFVHGWRHNSQIGDGNVADLRVYTADAARFVADRCQWGDTRYCGMKATGVYVGWRGARTDENRLQRALAPLVRAACGKSSCFVKTLADSVGTIAAAVTLFDRKPVSEAVAPAVYAALQSVELNIGLQRAIRENDLAPCEHVDLVQLKQDGCIAQNDEERKHQARMIVFGHSLGGNLLATALKDEIVKMVERHRPRRMVPNSETLGAGFHTEPADFLPAPIGNLVVLLNPASEAIKWAEIQRAVWRHIEMSFADKAHVDDYESGNWFFRPDQRPVIISVTAARDWPPGGLRPIDCIKFQERIAQAGANSKDLEKALREEWDRRSRSVDYDWATYDLFPAFRFDFRPIASSMQRYAERPPRGAAGDLCSPYHPQQLWLRLVDYVASFLRVAPFMNTDIEQTHTIGNLDPSRAPKSETRGNIFSGRPFGTTHEVRGWSDGLAARKSKQSLAYRDVVTPAATCRIAKNWLFEARRTTIDSKRIAENKPSVIFWDAQRLPSNQRPAVRFQHGFDVAGIAAITRPNDPFWNVRALDNALAEHDGYLQPSFICAMQQLVLDDVTQVPPPYMPPGADHTDAAAGPSPKARPSRAPAIQ